MAREDLRAVAQYIGKDSPTIVRGLRQVTTRQADDTGRTPGARLAGSTAGEPRAGRTSELPCLLPGSGRGVHGTGSARQARRTTSALTRVVGAHHQVAQNSTHASDDAQRAGRTVGDDPPAIGSIRSASWRLRYGWWMNSCPLIRGLLCGCLATRRAGCQRSRRPTAVAAGSATVTVFLGHEDRGSCGFASAS